MTKLIQSKLKAEYNIPAHGCLMQFHPYVLQSLAEVRSLKGLFIACWSVIAIQKPSMTGRNGSENKIWNIFCVYRDGLSIYPCSLILILH